MKAFSFKSILAFCFSLAIFVVSINLSAQVVEKKDSVANAATDSIPAISMAVSKILKTSCTSCHSNTGREKPRNAVNFSVWQQYSATEKLMLAGSIQEEVAKKSMPPKGFLNSHPEAALSDDQIALISQWCESLKTAK